MTDKVLLIEGEPQALNFLKHLLEDAGYETCCASSGRGACDIS